MTHSKKFETVKNWWTVFHKEFMIRNAVVMEWIKEDEYEEITGEAYKA